MRALILAAGRGTRLRPHTDCRPKCMITVRGRPLLDSTLEWLVAGGVRDIAVNLHHAPDVVTEHLGDGARFGVRVRYSYEPELLGTGGALLALAEWLGEEPFFVVFGDNYIRLDIQRFTAAHNNRAAMATVALSYRNDVGASGVAELNRAGRITRFIEKPRPGETHSHWINAGLVLCEPCVLGYIAPPISDFGRDVLPSLIAAGERVQGYKMGDGDFLGWVDTPEDLLRLEDTVRELEELR